MDFKPPNAAFWICPVVFLISLGTIQKIHSFHGNVLIIPDFSSYPQHPYLPAGKLEAFLHSSLVQPSLLHDWSVGLPLLTPNVITSFLFGLYFLFTPLSGPSPVFILTAGRLLLIILSASTSPLYSQPKTPNPSGTPSKCTHLQMWLLPLTHWNFTFPHIQDCVWPSPMKQCLSP